MTTNIVINDPTVRSLKQWLNGFPDHAKIKFIDPKTNEERELVICANFEHQLENDTVMLTSGFPVKFQFTRLAI